jgi:threonine/homoserine/homoserine lactone efflux protein
MTRALALGFIVGFPIAVSPGPIFFIVLRRTLARGWGSGLISGLGVATGDATYAALAAFGVAAVTSFLIAERRWIALVGGIAIALIGVRTIVSNPPPRPSPARGEGDSDPQAQTLTLPSPRGGGALRASGEGVGSYASMVALTLSNPPTILSFAAVFAGLGIHVAGGWATAIALVIGVLLGSLTWWVVLTSVASRLRGRLTPAVIRGIGIASGVALLGFGVVTVGAALTG